MNQKNFDYLKEGLKYLGFGEKLGTDLESNLKQQPAQFQLNLTQEYKSGKGEEKVDFKLDFKKS
ncbi:MAG: hypothetical protein ABL895_19830, partial [Cyclobacteriaceae bacterium]